MYSWWAPKIAIPVLEAITRRRIWSRVEELDRMQWLPADSLAERAGQKLGALVAHAARNVPYYRKMLSASGVGPGEITGVADLDGLPVSDKEVLRREPPEDLLAENLPPTRRLASTTSGSLGTPFAFSLDRLMVDRWVASYLFFLGWAGTALWHTGFVIAGPGSAPWIRDRSMLETLGRRLILGEHAVLFEGMRLSVEELRDAVSRLSRTRRFFLWAYASYAEHLAAEILASGQNLPRSPEVVICAAETLSSVGADNIRRAFSCPVVRHYSCLEVPRMAQSCPDNPAVYHVNSERTWIRIVDENGREVEPGECGRVIVTDLDNRVMPFINYDLGDIARRVEPCSCGRGLPTLGAIEGRQSEMLVLPNGSAVSPGALGGFLIRRAEATPYLEAYQLHEEGPETLDLKVVPTNRFTPEYAARLEAVLPELFGPGVRVSVQTVDRLAIEPSGKRLIIKRAGPEPCHE